MPQADIASAECSGNGDNVVLLSTADTYVTSFMLAQARRDAATWLPSGWFSLRLVEEEDTGFRLDHLILERVEGPPIGAYEIWREAGRFLVEWSPEEGLWWPESSQLGRFRSMEEAMMGILGHINRQLVAWKLPPLRHPAG